MSDIHHETLQFIADYTEKNGYPPSRREIMDVAARTSPSGAQRRVDRLVEKGLITVKKNVPRGIRITDEGRAELAGSALKADTEEL